MDETSFLSAAQRRKEKVIYRIHGSVHFCRLQAYRRALLNKVLAPTAARDEEVAEKKRKLEDDRKAEDAKKTLLEKHKELQEREDGKGF